MHRDLIVYSGVSAAIIACFGVCTWTLTRQASELTARMDLMEKRLATLHDDNCALAAKLGADCGFDLASAREAAPAADEASRLHFVPDDPQPAATGRAHP